MPRVIFLWLAGGPCDVNGTVWRQYLTLRLQDIPVSCHLNDVLCGLLS
jgi:hypothetical protein